MLLSVLAGQQYPADPAVGSPTARSAKMSIKARRQRHLEHRGWTRRLDDQPTNRTSGPGPADRRRGGNQSDLHVLSTA
ncbi:hypothetical protein [Rhodococcus qingshengii]|uniref:hypothetical protein n=1 Tax=Rhodococcus qingshengii TaxID=334542 RepID=UPI0022B5C949|nr:hypothetical protein [Rhodococcus qingshengii]MCZ4618728.1 hypothetical protein [Rhodococcus qingshengii]